MTALPRERLYALLPAIYRIRDVGQGEPLRALLGVIEEEFDRIENDIKGLYDNWFIETCDEWAVPYVGDLVGARLLHAVSQRAFTANTLAYRRRKGTLQTLAAIARDVTGWTARGVEYMQLLATAQQVNSARPNNIVIPDLSQLDVVENIGTPFESTARTVSVRSQGRYHRDQVGLFVWRLGAYRLETVRAVAAPQPGCFFADPLGGDTAMWSPADSRPGLTVTTELSSAPQRLRRTLLGRTLEARRQALVDGLTPQDAYFDGEPVLRVFVAGADGQPQAVPCEQILITELDPFWLPPSQRVYQPTAGGAAVTLPIQVAVDPERGRLAFPAGQAPRQVWTTYYYGFAAELGGGGYDREADPLPPGTRLVTVSSGDPSGTLQQLGDPTQAGSPWDGASGQLCVEIVDSDSYSVAALRVPAGGRLELRARSWQRPLLTPGQGADPRLHITLGQGATLVLSGLLVAGALWLTGDAVADQAVTGTTVTLVHSTLVPGAPRVPGGRPESPHRPSVQADTSLGGLALVVQQSISGAIDLSAATTASLTAADSIFDGTRSSLPTLQAPQATLARVTVLGSTQVGALSDTVDTLFCAPVNAAAGPPGGVRYSYLPEGSQVPQPYRCQPAMTLSVPGTDIPQTRIKLVPWFVSRRYGTPGYGQLDTRCHTVIRNGASVEGELGAMHALQHAQREGNLIDCQAEYLRFGITLNLFPVT